MQPNTSSSEAGSLLLSSWHWTPTRRTPSVVALGAGIRLACWMLPSGASCYLTQCALWTPKTDTFNRTCFGWSAGVRRTGESPWRVVLHGRGVGDPEGQQAAHYSWHARPI